jgi:hypothetical protein
VGFWIGLKERDVHKTIHENQCSLSRVIKCAATDINSEEVRLLGNVSDAHAQRIIVMVSSLSHLRRWSSPT